MTARKEKGKHIWWMNKGLEMCRVCTIIRRKDGGKNNPCKGYPKLRKLEF